MALTAESIRDDIIGALGNRTDLTEEYLYRQIHLAQLRVSRLKRWEALRFTFTVNPTFNTDPENDALISLTGQTPNFTLRSEIRMIETVALLDSTLARTSEEDGVRKLKKITTRAHWERLIEQRGRTELDEPTHYLFSEYDAQIEVHPRPDRGYQYRVRGYKLPTIVTESGKGNALDLPNMEDAIFACSMYRIFLRLKNREGYLLNKNEYDTLSLEITKSDDDQGEMEQVAITAGGDNLGSGDSWANPFHRGSTHIGSQVE